MTEEEFLQMYRAQKAQEKAADPDLSIPEMILGASRSYLAGPTFNYADNIEAALGAALNDNTYDEELALIRDQQDRFKRKAGYADDVLEFASGMVLNPLDKLGKVVKAGKTVLSAPGVQTAARLVASAPSQAALTSAGAADGEDVLAKAAMGGAVGTAGSVIGSIAGKALSETARQADRLKLSAYGITNAQLTKQLRDLKAAGVNVKSVDEIPLLNTLKAMEQSGVISAADDVLTNASKVKGVRDDLGIKLHEYVQELDKVIPAEKDWGWGQTLKEIDGLSGAAKEQAENIALRELAALEKQIGTGSLASLQAAKMGLRFTGKEDPGVGGAIVDAIRRDLRQAIETRIDNAASRGLIDQSNTGLIKNMNREWGDVEELYGNLYAKGASDLNGDLVNDALGQIRTSGGTGSLNVASAASGSIIPSIVGGALNATSANEVKSTIADLLLDPAINKPLQAIGDAIPNILTGRNTAQVYSTPRDGRTSAPYTQSRGSANSSSKDVNQESASSQNANSKSDANQQQMTEQEFLELYRKSKGGKAQQISSNVEPDDIDLAMASLYGSPDPDTDLGGINIEDLVRAVVSKESNGNQSALSPKGARGRMQLMPETAKELGVDPYDPIENIIGGTKYLVQNFKENEGDDALALMLARYNAGPGAVQKYGNSIPPFAETQDYVEKILAMLEGSPAKKGKSQNDFSSNAVADGGSSFS